MEDGVIDVEYEEIQPVRRHGHHVQPRGAEGRPVARREGGGNRDRAQEEGFQQARRHLPLEQAPFRIGKELQRKPVIDQSVGSADVAGLEEGGREIRATQEARQDPEQVDGQGVDGCAKPRKPAKPREPAPGFRSCRAGADQRANRVHTRDLSCDNGVPDAGNMPVGSLMNQSVSNNRCHSSCPAATFSGCDRLRAMKPGTSSLPVGFRQSLYRISRLHRM